MAAQVTAPVSPVSVVKAGSTVDLEIRRIQQALRDSATGPLVVASDVVKLAENWEEHRAECYGLDATSAFKKYLGFPLSFFQVRDRAVRWLGESVRRWMHHELAVWLIGGIMPPGQYDTARTALLLEYKRRGSRSALTKAQARPIVYEVVGHVPATATCHECDRLRAILKRLGVDPDK